MNQNKEIEKTLANTVQVEEIDGLIVVQLADAIDAIEKLFQEYSDRRLLEIIGEDEETGKRRTMEYTRKYVVDIRNHFRAELRAKLKASQKGESNG